MSVAARKTDSFEERYRRALAAYMHRDAEETQLMAAFELGRAALAEGYSLLDLLTIHHTVLCSAVELFADGAGVKQSIARANELLAQVAAPFEMAHRGWHDMAERLHRTNEELETRVAERTVAHREAVERLDRAQQIAGIGSWEIDVATGQHIWSKEMYRICGLPELSHVPNSGIFVGLIHEDDRERHARWFAELKAGRDPGPVEYRIKRPDGEQRVVSVDGEALLEPGSSAGKISCTLQDVSERRAEAARMQALQDELAHVSRLNTIGHMASGLAHELNQPLSAIASYLKGSRRMLDGRPDELSSTLREALKKAGDQAMRAGEVVRRLRDFMSRREIEFRVESLTALVKETAALALVGTGDTGLQVRYDLSAPVDLVLVDRIQVQQVLLNLLRNAVEAMQVSDRRQLAISTEAAADEMVLVGVADTGPGVAAEVAAKLFQPFVTSKQHGMGVGLSISRTIIESHGGRLWCDPNPDGGAIFRFTLRALTANEASEVNASADPHG